MPSSSKQSLYKNLVPSSSPSSPPSPPPPTPPPPPPPSSSSSSFYWTSVANAPNVLQPYWLIVLPLDVPDLTAILFL